MRARLAALAALALLALPTSSVVASTECTRVFGMSQTRNWYEAGGFEALVDPDAWELVHEGGSGTDDWADPSFSGWTKTPSFESCGGAPTRAIYHAARLGYSRLTDAQIAAEIAQVADNARALWGVAVVEVVPVVGGPDHQTCTIVVNGRTRVVDASRMHPRIDAAIALSGEVAGPDLLLEDCSGYADGMGHLTVAGSVDIAAKVAGFYGPG